MALLLVLLKVNAQIDTTSLAGKYEYIFQQLDVNQIPTGFIDERAFPLFSLTPFNGLLTDSNKVNIDTWRGLYFTLSTACLLSQNPFEPINVVNDSIAAHNSPTATSIPIAVLFGEYNSVKSYAFTANLLSIVNDQVLDVPNRNESPYLNKYIFAASPAKAQYPDENFSLIFPSNLFYSNSGLTVSARYIDFDDGYGYRSASWDTAISPEYTSSGDKTLKFKLVMSNNSVYECYSDIHVDHINNIQLLRYNPNVASFNQPFAPTSSHSGGNAIVRLSSNNSSGHIKKPLIVVEGYDAFSVAPTLSEGNYTYENFIGAINIPTTYDFNQALDDTGSYDLVFVDYNNGTDNIVRNAALLQEVITWVNNDKAIISSTEQNVVMGISMGGLVARYALANMTKNNIATQTRLLITHDSPHQGANVPLGFQKLAFAVGSVDVFGYKIRDVFPSYQEVVNLLNAPATTELLKYRVSSEFSNIISNTFVSSVYKPMVTFSYSDPQPTYRFIATSQGSECGTPIFAPGSNILNIQGNAGALIPFALSTGKANLEIQANALPNIGSSSTIAKVKFVAKVKLFGFITIAKDFYNYTSNITSSTFLPIDGAAGGTSPIGSLDASGISAGGDIPFILNYRANLNTATISNFCFVPTASALDVQNFDNSSLSAVNVGGWSPTNPSSAETYIAQESLGNGVFNERHTNFTARNAEWIFNEMQNSTNNNLNCSINCTPTVNASLIEGPEASCNGAIYSIPSLIPGTIVNWSATGNISIYVDEDEPTYVNVSKITNTGGGGVLSATFEGPCGNLTITKTINIKTPNPNVFGLYQTFEAHQEHYLSVNNPQPDWSYHWEIIGSNVSLLNGPGSNYGSSLAIGCDEPGAFTLRLTVTNSCGNIKVIEETLYVQGNYYRYSTYPNPAKDEIIVSIEDKGLKKTEKDNIDKSEEYINVSLYDDKGDIRTKAVLNKYKATILDTKNIPNGIYYLHINEGKKTIKKQVIIQH